jgi:ABC-type transport system involved in cytochrome c biogenesis permease subunit
MSEPATLAAPPAPTQPRLGPGTPLTRSRLVLWCLAGVGLLVNALLVALVVSLVAGPGTVDPPADRRIRVPFEHEDSLWQPFRRWVVQEDGRNKPFDTFCRESVRALTGRERFETVRSPTTGRVVVAGHDPVAVVVSWMLVDAASAGRTADCDWEHHPFLLCRSPELRELLYQEYRGDSEPLSEQDLHGTHVEPAVLRSSSALRKLLAAAARKEEEEGKGAVLPVEREALEVMSRLRQYDCIRAGGAVEDGKGRPRLPGEYQVVALDRGDSTWFSLQSLRAYADAPALWESALKRRKAEAPTSYEGQPPQPFPAAETAEVLAAFTEMRQAYLSGDASFSSASAAYFASLEEASSRFNRYPDTDTTALELWYNHVNPFQKSWLVSALSALLLAGSLLLGKRWGLAGRLVCGAGLLALVGSLAWAVVGFYCRVVIAGRPPVSNMYESIVWVAFLTAVFGLVLELIYRRRVIALAAALVSTLGLVLADQLPLTFSPAIQPLQAVLRSNYWLVVHVITIVSSYAPFAVAWGLGNLNLALILFAPHRRDLIQTLSRFAYRCIQAGILLLFLGTMLGGWWAAESWGRFWGWDPKEVWALLALVCYLIPLHARYVGWVRDFGLAVCSVVCFASVVMAWYGVNFVLGAGLHSYGFGSGGNAGVYLVGLLNINLVLLAAWRYLYCRPNATPGPAA